MTWVLHWYTNVFYEDISRVHIIKTALKHTIIWINNCIIVLCVPCLMSSVHEMDFLGKDTVSVSGRSGAQSSVASKRACAEWEGSRVILPALLLTLYKYSSWRVGRVVPMIRSAVRTTLRSLLRSDLVAELNPTDEQMCYWCAEFGFNDGRVELFQVYISRWGLKPEYT